MREMPQRFAGTLARLLRPVGINTGFAQAVLEGTTDGRVWSHPGAEPVAVHALTGYDMSLIWGAGVDLAYADLIAHLRRGRYRRRAEWLQVDPQWAHLDWDRRLGAVPGTGGSMPHRVQRFVRLNFRFDPAAFAAAPEPALPPGWALRAMTAADFALPGLAVAPPRFWADAETFLALGGGVCAVRGEMVGALAFGCYRFGGALEIGIETLAPFRGQGLGRAVAHAAVRRIFGLGLTPVWSCRENNRGSVRLAQSAGFRILRRLPFYRLPAGPLAG